MARLIVHPDGRREIVSKKTRNRGRRRAKGHPVVESNNRAAKRAEMAHIPAQAKIGPNNSRVAGRKAYVQRRFS